MASMMSRSCLFAPVLALLISVPASAAELRPTELGPAELGPVELGPVELGFEPQLVSQDASWGDVVVEAIAGLDAQRIGGAYEGYLYPGAAVSYALLPFATVGAVYEPGNDRAFPLSVEWGFGALSLSHELAYHAQIGADHQWTFDSEIHLDLVAGWGVYHVLRTTASSLWAGLTPLYQAGITHSLDGWLSLRAGIGQGLRDTPFDVAETAGLVAVALTL
jgi:hypothetical protein